MIIANQKLQENIIEYILYMWQLEDIIRAYNFDTEKINTELVSKFKTDDKTQLNIKEWYTRMCNSMIEEKIQTSGHLSDNNKYIAKLNNVHTDLIESDTNYSNIYNECKSAISELNKKSGFENRTPVETILDFLYGILILRLKNQNISADTSQYVSLFGKLMSILGSAYHKK